MTTRARQIPRIDMEGATLEACASRHAVRAYASVLRKYGSARHHRRADQLTAAANAAQLRTRMRDR